MPQARDFNEPSRDFNFCITNKHFILYLKDWRNHCSHITRLNNNLWLSCRRDWWSASSFLTGLGPNKENINDFSSNNSSVILPFAAELNQSSTTFAAKPRFLRFKIARGRNFSQTRLCSHLRSPPRTL